MNAILEIIEALPLEPEAAHAVMVVLGYLGIRKGGAKVKQKAAVKREQKAGEPTLADVKAQIDSADRSIQKLWDERDRMKPQLKTLKVQADKLTVAVGGLGERMDAVEAATDPKLRVWSGQE